MAGEAEATELPRAAALRLEAAFARDPAQGLLHLGAAEPHTALPPTLAYWRDFARRFVAGLCAHDALDAEAASLEVPPPSTEELTALAASAPPMIGGEYLDAALLARLWQDLHGAWRARLAQQDAPARALLASLHASWGTVGRVHFHLAENKRDGEHPFAFLATYTEGLSARGRPLHRPLGDALRESAGALDRGRLKALLGPVQRAAERGARVRALVESRELFHPLAWTPSEAHAFLQEVPALEEAGVVVRVPDWWRARSRPRVSVRVGDEAPTGLGLESLLSFRVELTLDGEPLSRAELAKLLRQGDGLVSLRGRWVEVDRERLQQVLAHWQQVERESEDGVTFLEGMRLLAGAPLGDAAQELGEDAERHWEQVQSGPWLTGLLDTLRGPEALRETRAIPGLTATLRPYQQAGVHWLHVLTRLGLGALLADDMGLGKTLQVLALLLWRKAQAGGERAPHLLVVPASLLGNWQEEARRFAPSLKLLLAHPSARAASELARLEPREVEAHDVVLTTYGTVSRLPWVRERRWGLVVLDEAQAIKNPSARQTRAVKGLTAEARVALTGTPVENRLGDLWSLYDFLNPGLLGSAREFSGFLKTQGTQGYAPLRALVRPYLLRRLKSDPSVVKDLPDKTEARAECLLTPEQAALYARVVEDLKAQLESAEGMKRRGLVLATLLRLKQLCNHPSHYLGDGRWTPEASGKFHRLAELCETVAARQEKVLVFTQFRELCEPLADFLAGLFPRAPRVLHGGTPVRARTGLVRDFQQEEGAAAFVLSLKAGGTGLNLTAASHVIHFDRWWNPAVENQATDRAYRIGQRRNVLVHKFVCRGTVEERIEQLLEGKRALARDVVEGGGEVLLTELPDAELLRLVSLDVKRAREEG
ncbi:DEAD/DEAH box helicase [Aggregicoccus sp. 17bor-14]|uniref:DEAD/DEAH box helicase n=1 Tax=Myxococcaceae TaxID=31 RepID=UPI00351A5A8B